MITKTWEEKYESFLDSEIMCCESRKADKRFVDDYDEWIKCLKIRKDKLHDNNERVK